MNTAADLRDAQIEAVRQVLGWDYETAGEYADSMRETLGEIVDAAMGVVGPYVQITEDVPVEHFLCPHDMATVEAYANGEPDA